VNVWSYVPAVTPIGKLVKYGTVVATPAVVVVGGEKQQCMCDAVVPEVRPAKLTCTRIMTVSGE
jgi:hypothetical protein